MSKARHFRNKGKNRNVTGINAAQLREAEEEFKVKVDGDEKLQENINKSIVNKEINQEFDQEASITNERVPSTKSSIDPVSAQSVTVTVNNNPVAKPPRNVSSSRTVSRAPEEQPPARLASSSEESEDDEPLHDMNEGDLQQQVFDLEDRIDDLEMDNKKLRAQIELKDLEIEKLQKEARKAERQRNRVGGTRTRATRAKETDL